MPNATSWEVAWATVFALISAFGVGLLGFLVARLVRRYQARRNGGGRLLAWKDMWVAGFLATAGVAGLVLGMVAMASPGGGVASPGPIERWAAEWLAYYAVPILVLIGLCILGALVSIAVCEYRISRYLRTAADPDGLEHPDMLATRLAALELASAAKLAAEQVADAAAVAAVEVASAARLAAEMKTSVGVATDAATVNTAALKDNTEAVRQNTHAQEGKE